MSRTCTIGVVGCGYWGPNLVRNLQGVPACSVRHICDLNPARLDHMATLYSGIRTTQEYDDLLSDDTVDAIVVATPVKSHYGLGMQALEAGKHLLLEKSMASSSEECRRLVDKAARADRVLMVGHTFLFSPAVRAMKQIIDNGDIGAVQYISSRRLNLGLYQEDINVIWDLAPHDLSIITHLENESPRTVNCQGVANVTPGIEDVTTMALHFPGGGFACIHNSWLEPRKVREMTIVGTRRMIVYDDLEPLQKIRIYDIRVDPPPHYDTYAEFQYAYHYGDMMAPHVPMEEPLKLECRHFVECCLRGEQPLTDGRAGLSLVRVLEAASESLSQFGRQVAVHSRPHPDLLTLQAGAPDRPACAG